MRYPTVDVIKFIEYWLPQLQQEVIFNFSRTNNFSPIVEKFMQDQDLDQKFCDLFRRHGVDIDVHRKAIDEIKFLLMKRIVSTSAWNFIKSKIS